MSENHKLLLETTKRHLAYSYAHPDWAAMLHTLGTDPQSTPELIGKVIDALAESYGENLLKDVLKNMQTAIDEVTSVLSSYAKPYQKPLIPLTDMTEEDFMAIFNESRFAPEFMERITESLSSLWGFHNAIAKYGVFSSYRKAVELGYDVEFTLSQP